LRVDALFDDNSHKEPPSFLPHHRLSGSATECDGLEDPPCARTIDIASHLAPGLPGKADDKFQDQAASGAVWYGS
jgi:hypothetical protein